MKALVTAGPTQEPIDPVRFVGNHSSGKMGIAIADELASRGYEVTLVKGPITLNPAHTEITQIEDTKQRLKCMQPANNILRKAML